MRKENGWQDLLRREGGSILMTVFGLLLALVPDLASAALSAAAGWILIAAGVAALIVGFVGTRSPGSILFGALLLLAGRWLHRSPLMITSVIGVVLGLLVLSQGLRTARKAGWTRRAGGFWIPGTVLAAAELLVGLRLIFTPVSASRLVLRIAGILMAICGGCALAAAYRGTRHMDGDSRIIDADP